MKVSEFKFYQPLSLLKYLVLPCMPHYRIVIWIRDKAKPKQGIRLIDNYNITLVQGQVEKKARDHYNSNLVDVEVQMLPKTCSAVRRWMEKRKEI